MKPLPVGFWSWQIFHPFLGAIVTFRLVVNEVPNADFYWCTFVVKWSVNLEVFTYVFLAAILEKPSLSIVQSGRKNGVVNLWWVVQQEENPIV